MTKKQRLKQIEYRLLHGIGPVPENIDSYAQELKRQTHYIWAAGIAVILFGVLLLWIYLNTPVI